MRLIKVCTVMSLLFAMGQARADDPVDKNFGGPYVGGQFVLGQGQKVGNSASGPAYLVGADVGYGIKRDTWNRIEIGLELDKGKASFTDKSSIGDIKVNLDLNSVIMIKAGYGYSLGDSAFGVFRIGAGIVDASYDGKIAGQKIDGGTSSGVATMIGWDTIFPASPALDFLFGASFRFFNLSFDDLDNGNLQLNFPGLYAGARVRF